MSAQEANESELDPATSDASVEGLLVEYLGAFMDGGPDTFAANFVQRELLKKGVDLGEDHWGADTGELDPLKRFDIVVSLIVGATEAGSSPLEVDELAPTVFQPFFEEHPELMGKLIERASLRDEKERIDNMSGVELVKDIATRISEGWDGEDIELLDALDNNYVDQSDQRWSDGSILQTHLNLLYYSKIGVEKSKKIPDKKDFIELYEEMAQVTLLSLWETLLTDGLLDVDTLRGEIRPIMVKTLRDIKRDDSAQDSHATQRLLDIVAKNVYDTACLRAKKEGLSPPEIEKIATVAARADSLIG